MQQRHDGSRLRPRRREAGDVFSGGRRRQGSGRRLERKQLALAEAGQQAVILFLSRPLGGRRSHGGLLVSRRPAREGRGVVVMARGVDQLLVLVAGLVTDQQKVSHPQELREQTQRRDGAVTVEALGREGGVTHGVASGGEALPLSYESRRPVSRLDPKTARPLGPTSPASTQGVVGGRFRDYILNVCSVMARDELHGGGHEVRR